MAVKKIPFEASSNMMEPTFRGQHKKPRLDIGQKDDVWGADEDFPDEVLVQVDLAATQAYSQVNVTKKLKSDGKFQRHHSWTGASNDEDSQTSSNVPKWHSFQIHNIENISNEVAGTKPKSTQSFFPNKSVKCQPTYQCNQLISQSCVQELERQKHEVSDYL